MDGEGVEDIDRVVAELDGVQADLVFLQEVHGYAAGPSQAEKIADQLHYGACAFAPISMSHLDPAATSGLAILARAPLRQVEYRPLPTPSLQAVKDGAPWRMFSKGVLTATMSHRGVDMAVASVHAHPFHHFSRQALEPEFAETWRVLDEILAHLARGVAVCGADLNHAAVERLLPDATALGLMPTLRSPTTPQGLLQDFILHSVQFIAKASEARPVGTDHHLLTSRLCLRPPSST